MRLRRRRKRNSRFHAVALVLFVSSVVTIVKMHGVVVRYTSSFLPSSSAADALIPALLGNTTTTTTTTINEEPGDTNDIVMHLNNPSFVEQEKTTTILLDDDGCGLHLAAGQTAGFHEQQHNTPPAPAPPHWKPYDSQQSNYMKEVETCVMRISFWTWRWSRVGPRQMIDTTLGMLDCQQDRQQDGHGHDFEDIQQSLRNWAKQYRHIWFVGDSILGQQFDVLQCMLDPDATLDNHTELSRYFVYNHALDKIDRSTIVQASEREQVKMYAGDDAEQFMLLHNETLAYPFSSTINSTGTSFERITHGFLFDKQEKALYQTAFPTLMNKYATSHDAIVMNAGAAHYDHTRMDNMDKALRRIARASRESNTPIFYMEPTPENWKTSNGMFKDIKPRYNNGCHPLSEARMNGTDSSEGVHQMQPLSELNSASMNIYTKLYPELFIPASNINLAKIAPKASWRSDLARSIFREEGSSSTGISGDVSKVKLVPIFWQFAMSKNVSSNVHEEDCSHRSLSAIVNMNIQMVRIMASQ